MKNEKSCEMKLEADRDRENPSLCLHVSKKYFCVTEKRVFVCVRLRLTYFCAFEKWMYGYCQKWGRERKRQTEIDIQKERETDNDRERQRETEIEIERGR
jgi:hypothetical protein